MYATHRNTIHRLLASGAGLAVAVGWIVGPATTTAEAASTRSPHVLHGIIAETIVEVGGGVTCSGTPIAGTRYVITAAHCVIDAHGHVHNRTVIRDGHEYESVAVLVDTRYHDEGASRLDAAVLVMEEPIPGPAATLGRSLPDAGVVTLAGFQRLGDDGSLLRPVNARQRLPHSEAGRSPAGCERPAASISVTDDQVRMECGLVKGASGGGLFRMADGNLQLIGILSAVTHDVSANLLVPPSQLWSLLDQPEIYRHVPERTQPDRVAVSFS